MINEDNNAGGRIIGNGVLEFECIHEKDTKVHTHTISTFTFISESYPH